VTATDLTDARTQSFGDTSTSTFVKSPVNGWLSALPRAKLKLILGVIACLMAFRNGGHYNDGTGITGLQLKN